MSTWPLPRHRSPDSPFCFPRFQHPKVNDLLGADLRVPVSATTAAVKMLISRPTKGSPQGPSKTSQYTTSLCDILLLLPPRRSLVGLVCGHLPPHNCPPYAAIEGLASKYASTPTTMESCYLSATLLLTPLLTLTGPAEVPAVCPTIILPAPILPRMTHLLVIRLPPATMASQALSIC